MIKKKYNDSFKFCYNQKKKTCDFFKYIIFITRKRK